MIKSHYNTIFKASPLPSLILLPDTPRFTITDVSAAYLEITGTKEADLIGKGFFEAFPDNPEDISAVFNSNLRHSLLKVIGTHKPDKMITQNYGIPFNSTGKFEVRYWEPENIPVLDNDDRVCCIIHTVLNRIERQSSFLMNNIETFFVLLDNDLKIISFNKRFQKLYKEYFGYDVKRSESLLKFAQPERKEAVEEKCKLALAGATVESDVYIRVIGGAIMRFVTKYSPAKDENDNIIGVFVIASDIKEDIEPKNNQEALINNTDDLIWSLNSDFKLIAANKAFIQSLKTLSGITLQAGDDLMKGDVFPADLLAFWKEDYERALRGQSFKKEIFRPTLPAMKESWSEINFNPIYNGNVITGVACYSRDITERKSVEAEIIMEKNLSDSIIKSLPGIFYLFNKEGRFLRWNRNFETITKYSAAEITEMDPLDLFDGAEKELIAEKVRNVFIQGEDNVQANFLLKTKEKIPYYFTGVTIEYESSACLLGVGIDMSESVETQEKIRQTTDQVRKLALHLQTIREEERKRIGHEIHDELGQQLTAIHMDVAWIDKQVPKETKVLKRKLKNILELLGESHQSIRRILSELKPGILDDHGLLDAIVWLGAQFTENTGIPVTFTTTETGVKCSEQVAICIFRVYQEALTNITRYAHAGKVSISLTITGEDITVIIEDNGIGFDMSFIQNKKSFGLLGMRERVLSLGGRYEIVTQSGKGTKITIELQNIILN